MTAQLERPPPRFTPGPDQEELRSAVRSFLAARCPESAVREQMETALGHDPVVWRQLAGQLGLAGIDVPEELGGSGGTFRDLAIVQEELGRSLACLPYLSTVVLAAGALLLGDDEDARERYLPGIAGGTTLAALAVAEDSGSWAGDTITTRAEQSADAWILHGRKSFVVDGSVADLLLVAAQAAEGLSLFAVEATAAGLTRTRMRTLDLTRTQATLDLDGVPATLVGQVGGAGPLLSAVRDRAVTALACEQLGGAQRTLETAVEHARTRLQFGRPIGSFQAVKHRCADMALHVDAARSAVAWAVAAAAEAPAELPVAAAVAQVRCSTAYVYTSAENVQVHGGIGFTWEHAAHLHFRRARSSAVLLGDVADARERLLTGLGV